MIFKKGEKHQTNRKIQKKKKNSSKSCMSRAFGWSKAQRKKSLSLTLYKEGLNQFVLGQVKQ